jgi:soluble lytic murein transglycosylase-like protein
VRRWEPLILKYAAQYQIDPDLVAAVMTVESSGNPNAVSYAGAVGLMQVMPYDPYRFPNRPAAAKLYDPDFNVAWGLRILADELEWARGDVFKALMAYYDGRWTTPHPGVRSRSDEPLLSGEILAPSTGKRGVVNDHD